MSYEKSQKETETLSADEQKLRAMCLSLKKADAPADFDFKLKARIASAKPADFQPRFGFAFRYALPALALILMLGLVVYNGGFLASKDNPPVVESAVVPQNPEQPQNSAVSSFAPPEQASSNSSAVVLPTQTAPKVPESAVAARNPSKSQNEKKREVKNDNFNGSGTSTFRIAPVIRPNGFDQKSTPQNVQNIESSNPLRVKEVLSINGINADFENGKWKVKSVTANGVGESSGVKENDIIEAIDNQPLSAETVFIKTVKGNTMTVTRGGEKTVLKLRNKQ